MFAISARCFGFLTLAVLLAYSSPLPAQTDGDEPPSAGQPANFSQVVGTYRISKFTAQPTDVIVEDPVTVTIHITGKGPSKHQPRRGPLRLFDNDAKHDFYIEPVPDQDKITADEKGEKTWVFVYLLRPKSTRVREVPEPRLSFYMPRSGYKTARRPPDEEPIPLTVKPRPEVKPADLGLTTTDIPDRFYQIVAGDSVLANDHQVSYWSLGLLTAVGFGAPTVSWLALLLWQWLFPDSIGRHRRRRSRAARRAIQKLGAARGNCSALFLCNILTEYLSQRLDFHAVEPTPLELARFLERRGIAKQVGQQWAGLFRSFDEARFTPPSSGTGSVSWPKQAVSLIHALEADPCLAKIR